MMFLPRIFLIAETISKEISKEILAQALLYKNALNGANGDPIRQQGDYSFLLVVEADKNDADF